MTSIMMMNHERAPLSILSNHTLAVTYLVCWWLVNHFPRKLVSGMLSRKPCKMLIKACTQLCRAKLIQTRINLAVEMYPNNLIGPLIIGTLCACGGKLTQDTVRLAQGVLVGPHEANVQTYSSRSAFLCALFYLLACKWPATAVMTQEEAFSAMALLLVVHVIAAEWSGRPLDWTLPIVNTLLLVTNIAAPATPLSGPSHRALSKSGSGSTAAADRMLGTARPPSQRPPATLPDAFAASAGATAPAAALSGRVQGAFAAQCGGPHVDRPSEGGRNGEEPGSPPSSANRVAVSADVGVRARARKAKGGGKPDGDGGWKTVSYGPKRAPDASKSS